MNRSSPADREYFQRIERANRALDDEPPPESLAEMFDRLDRIRKTHGLLARPGRDGGEGDLESHLAFLERIRERRGTLSR